jgi:hypothetical protein
MTKIRNISVHSRTISLHGTRTRKIYIRTSYSKAESLRMGAKQIPWQHVGSYRDRPHPKGQHEEEDE